MKYLKLNAALEVTEISDEYPIAKWGEWEWGRREDGSIGAGWISKQDISQHPTPEISSRHIADSASNLGDRYIATDSGEPSRHRYSIARAPAIGDPVSRSLRGDSCPCGVIVKISKSFRRVETSEGKAFFRQKQTGRWMQSRWSLINGHREERNNHLVGG